ncbi:MAG: dihydroorotase [Myxococcota bacterium]
MYDLLIEDATIIQAGRRRVADICVTDGVISYIGDRPAGSARRTISAIGRFVMPGAIDASVTVSVPGSDEDWESLSRAAAAGGVTTLIAQAPARDAAEVEVCEAAASRSVVSHGHWGLATPDNAEVLNALWAEGRICGTRTAPDALSDAHLTQHLMSSRAPLGVHADGIESIQRLLPLLEAHSRPTHLFGLSTAAETELLDPLFSRLPLTGDIAPSHLFLSMETATRTDVPIHCRPPLRPELDRRAMWTAIKRGRIHTFASGHVPHPHPAPGSTPPAGLPGIDTLLRLLLSAVASGRMGLEEMVGMCTEAPARIFGLAGKGRLEEGADADLVLFREGKSRKLTASELHSAAGWSPFVGRTLAEPPQLVLVGGRIVARDGKLTEECTPAAPVRYRHV